jgi:Predicted RNA-binding protein homologous to eukaryotic snRNP
MAFDAGFLAAIIHELQPFVGTRVERVQQPDRDAVVFVLRAGRGDRRLLINAGSNTPRIQLTADAGENPKAPPMFCMLLRKHLIGAKLTSVEQIGFERAVRLTFETRDELGFTGREHIIAELMGRFSDIILTDENDIILGAEKLVDFSDSKIRQILPGLKYTVPPLQPMTADASAVLGECDGDRYKFNPLEAEHEIFIALRENSALPDEKFISAYYYGISAAVAREIAFRAAGGGAESLWKVFGGVMADIREGRFTPVSVSGADGNKVEYSFMPLTHYGPAYRAAQYPDFGAMMDAFFTERDTAERYRQRATDLHRLVANAEARLTKKIALQQADLAGCADKDRYKQLGDLITSNIYKIKRGDTRVNLTDYTADPPAEVAVELDSRLTPAQNAQKYYKKYAKSKSAELALAKQIELARVEQDYIASVADALSRARSEVDLTELRRELYESGYASKLKNYVAVRPTAPKPQRFRTAGGYEVLCGRNNTQNDHVTFKLATKADLWFHVKGMPGSHVVLLCSGEEPGEVDYTQAAVIAATYSKAARGVSAPVDYTRVKNVKKPTGSKPGYVTYSSNFTAYASPDEELCAKLKI